MTLYTPEVRQFVNSQDWPKGLQLDVIEETANMMGLASDYLNFVVYYDNWMTFEPHEHIKIANLMKHVMETLRANGIPCYMERMETRNA